MVMIPPCVLFVAVNITHKITDLVLFQSSLCCIHYQRQCLFSMILLGLTQCNSNTCLNGATCISSGTTTTITCSCAEGWTGDICSESK